MSLLGVKEHQKPQFYATPALVFEFLTVLKMVHHRNKIGYVIKGGRGWGGERKRKKQLLIHMTKHNDEYKYIFKASQLDIIKCVLT